MKNDIELLEFAGSAYVIDFEAFSKVFTVEPLPTDGKIFETKTTTHYDGGGVIQGSNVVTKEYPRGKEMDVSRYEMVKFMLEIVMNYNEEVDDSLGIKRALDGLPISFKVAFNTLVKYGILKEVK